MRYFEMNQFGEASPTSILALLEETAADHCYAINHSLYDLFDQNIGWVLVSGIMKMERYPVYKEKITIRTWLSSYTTIKGFRENIIYDEQGNIIGRAKGLWVFFDIERRRPAQIFDDIKDKWSFCTEESLEQDIVKKLAVPEDSEHMRRFKVNRFDVDTNHHVNNLRYFQWALDSVPEVVPDNNFLHIIDGRFISEANLGDEILSFAHEEEQANSFLHNIKTSLNGKVCATARTVWKRRG